MLKRNKVYVKLHNLKNIVRNNEVMKLFPICIQTRLLLYINKFQINIFYTD